MDSLRENRTVTLQRNPLLIDTVIKCVFEYLPLKDLKQCRAVCQEWNSESIKILNKKSTIKLDSEERITHFLEFYKYYDNQTFPFTTFDLIDLHFGHTDGNIEEWEQLIDFFNALRENIITLILADFGRKLNLNSLIEIATNLESLTLWSIDSAIELDKLRTVKNLSLIDCHVSLDSFENRIAPLSIHMMNVTFERNKNKLQDILINDYIDFSRCSKITILISSSLPILTFDMSRDTVSAQKVDFNRIRVINWVAKPSKVDKRMLNIDKNTGIRIKQLYLRSSKLNLSMLPKSLEKLILNRNTYDTKNYMPVDLPNLKFLYLRPVFDDTTAIMSPSDYDMGIITSMFRLCPKLVDVELSGMFSNHWGSDINVNLMPVNLKRIKLSLNENINFVGDAVIHVDILILDTGTFADAQNFMEKIKPKIVVVQLQQYEVENPTGEIVSFVEESRNLEKVIIQVPNVGADEVLSSYRTALATYFNYDDEESKYYEFTNQVGKCLTEQEFKMYWF